MSQQEINKIIIDTLLPYHPIMIGLFGSRVRDDNREDSDLDILVNLKKPIGLFEFGDLEESLSGKLGIKVDLVSESGIRNPLLKKYILKDLKVIYAERW